MEKLSQFFEGIKKIDEGKIFQKTIERKESREIIKKVNSDRLSQGVNVDGSFIENQKTGKKTYSKSSVKRYAKIGRTIREGQNYTMEYTGTFKKSIESVEISGEGFSVKGERQFDESENIFDKFGNDLLGLAERGDDGIKELSPIFADEFLKAIKNE